MNNEVFKFIPGFDKRYAINKDGAVLSFCDNKIRLIKPYKAGKGYLRVTLHKEDGGCVKEYVHRLVALVFIPPVVGKNYVNHKDGVKTNNHTDNLEWCTQSENVRHGLALRKLKMGVITTC